MAGAWLPLAVLSCFGLAALRNWASFAARPGFILALILIVAFEYYSPIDEDSYSTWRDVVAEERLAFLDWLKQEETNEIRLINLPFGWHNSQRYS